jgi:hypothetical protein
MIVIHIWQKLSSVEREVLFVTNFWQFFHKYVAKPRLSSQIFGETQHSISLSKTTSRLVDWLGIMNVRIAARNPRK